MTKKLHLIIGAIFFLILFVFLINFIWTVFIPVKIENSKIIDIPSKMSAFDVAMLLKKESLIKNSKYFQILAGITGKSRKIYAGKYKFDKNINMFSILRKLSSGKEKLHTFVIFEGATIRQIARLLANQGLVNEDRFIQLSKDERICKYYEIPVNSLEGYLFPDTYSIPSGFTEEEIISIMAIRFGKVVNKDYYRLKANKKGFSLHQIITIASIIEKEAKMDEERKIISAVFHNRLNKNKNLESCATVIYALSLAGKHKTRLHDRDLLIKSPFNTYYYSGLPPGPICNPGKDSIDAALDPANVHYIYFVSKRDGTHYFSEKYAEHKKAVQKWRR